MREKLEVPIKSLSEDEVAQLTKLLSWRPTYGIARPSGKWLARQQEQMGKLPDTLLEPKNLLHRELKKISVGARQLLGDLQLARPLAERAVLCAIHERLNPCTIRELFRLVFLEMGSHLDPLRAWPHKSPTMAMFLTRVDSISALVMSKEFFVQPFKAAPHDERFARVESECDACILSILGGNGRCLADLWAATKLREGHANLMSMHRSKRPKTPRLTRFVSHWIRSTENPQTVYAWAEEVMADIRPIHHDIKRHWRDRNKKQPEKASKGKSQPRHVVALPRAQAESESMDQRRVAALYRQGMGQAARRVYCEDSLVNEAIPAPSAYYPPYGHGVLANAPADEWREGAFRSPGAGMDRSVYDDSWDHDVEDMDLEPGERGPGYSAQNIQDRVADWYSQVGDGGAATAEALHPALRPSGGRRLSQNLFTHYSAVPPPLHPTPPPPESSFVGARAGWRHPPRASTPIADPQDRRPPVVASRDPDAQTEWTDCTVHTYQPPRAAADEPPVPRLSSLYGDLGAGSYADRQFPPSDGASTPRRHASSSRRQPPPPPRRTPSFGGHHHNARSPLLPPPSLPSPSAGGRYSSVNAANLGRLDAEEQRKWERDLAPGDDIDVHDSISNVAPRSEATTFGGLIRRHERGR